MNILKLVVPIFLCLCLVLGGMFATIFTTTATSPPKPVSLELYKDMESLEDAIKGDKQFAIVNIVSTIATIILAVYAFVKSGWHSMHRYFPPTMAAISILMYFLTQPLARNIIYIDKWTVLFLICFALALLCVLLAREYERDDEDDYYIEEYDPDDDLYDEEDYYTLEQIREMDLFGYDEKERKSL